jgi:hypothetical protein
MNTKINNLIIALILLISSSVFSQEKISIVVLKGSVMLQKSTTESIKINRGKKMTIPTNSGIVLRKNSAAILFNSSAKIEVGSAVENKLSYIEINKLLKKNKPTSLTKNFIAYLDKMYADVEAQSHSYGATIAASSRGEVEDENVAYSPINGTLILSDSLELSIGSEETKLTSTIVVTNTTTHEVVYNDKLAQNPIKLNGLKPGNYTWEYTIDTKENNSAVKSTFSIPTSSEREVKLKEIADFKANLNDCHEAQNCLSDSIKELLLTDFLAKNKYYLYP